MVRPKGSERRVSQFAEGNLCKPQRRLSFVAAIVAVQSRQTPTMHV